MEDKKAKSIKTWGILIFGTSLFATIGTLAVLFVYSFFFKSPFKNIDKVGSTGFSYFFMYFEEMCLITFGLGICYLIASFFVIRRRKGGNKLMVGATSLNLFILLLCTIGQFSHIHMSYQETVLLLAIYSIAIGLMATPPIILLLYFGRKKISPYFQS